MLNTTETGFVRHLTQSYTGGGHKVLALVSKIRIFETNTATATKFGDFSQNLSGKTMVC